MAVLIGMSEEVKGKNFPLDREETTIGRNGENAIVLDNPTVSARHCNLRREGTDYVLRDLGSTNGTRVNSRDIKESRLKPKDIVQVGSIEFVFDSEHTGNHDVRTGPEAQVEVAPGPAAAPESFDSISPFGARKESGKGWWFFLIAVVGILALIAVIVLFFKLVTTG